MKRKIFLFLIIFLVLFFLKTQKTEELELEEEKEPEEYTLVFAGDVMLDRGVRYMVEKHGQDYSFPFLKIKERTEGADIFFANLESMISDQGNKIGSIYSFRASPLAMQGLVSAGINVVSLANNHTFDYNRLAFEDTMKRLKENDIKYTGAGFNSQEAHSATVFDLKEVKVGFLGYTEFLYDYAFSQENRSGITVLNQENLERDIRKAREEVDFLIVTFHYGDEYQKEPNEKQISLSRKAIDYGASLVIGHHPHVVQSIEKYQGKYIAYSLGNFIFDQYFSQETMNGFLLEVKLKNKEIASVRKIHYQLNEFYQPEFIEIQELDKR
jgi:gamma-polyglutamate biosynthesis protein CapA